MAGTEVREDERLIQCGVEELDTLNMHIASSRPRDVSTVDVVVRSG